MQRISHLCDVCGDDCTTRTVAHPVTGERVAIPLVIRTTAGVPPGFEYDVDIRTLPLPALLRDIVANPSAHDELCVTCWLARFGAELDWGAYDTKVAAWAEELERRHQMDLETARDRERPRDADLSPRYLEELRQRVMDEAKDSLKPDTLDPDTPELIPRGVKA